MIIKTVSELKQLLDTCDNNQSILCQTRDGFKELNFKICEVVESYYQDKISNKLSDEPIEIAEVSNFNEIEIGQLIITV